MDHKGNSENEKHVLRIVGKKKSGSRVPDDTKEALISLHLNMNKK